MFNKIIKIHSILVSLCLITSCATNNTSTEDAAAKKKIETAKINTQLGMAYIERHEMSRAKQKFLLALEQGPDIPETWYSMGYFMEVTGDNAEAKNYYLKAVKLAPKQGDVQNNFGTFLCRSGDYRGAIQHFMTAVENPEYLDTASAYENAGLCALKIPDKKLALAYFDQAVMQDPNHIVALLESADLEYQFKNYREAKLRLDEYLAIAAPTPQTRKLSAELGGVKTFFPPNGLA